MTAIIRRNQPWTRADDKAEEDNNDDGIAYTSLSNTAISQRSKAIAKTTAIEKTATKGKTAVEGKKAVEGRKEA